LILVHGSVFPFSVPSQQIEEKHCNFTDKQGLGPVSKDNDFINRGTVRELDRSAMEGVRNGKIAPNRPCTCKRYLDAWHSWFPRTAKKINGCIGKAICCFLRGRKVKFATSSGRKASAGRDFSEGQCFYFVSHD
jgi:hypothetical protein